MEEEEYCDEWKIYLNNFHRVIEEDGIKELKRIFASPDFNINKEYYYTVPHIFNPYHSIKTSLIGFSTLCDSIKCFRFFLINWAKLTNDDSILNLAIAGENVEIMQLHEQSQIRPGPSNIKYSIVFHRKEIFDWHVDQFLESLDEESSSLSFEHEFLHGIYRLERISLSDVFVFSCMIGSVSLVKAFLFI